MRLRLARMVTRPMSADILLRGQLRYLSAAGFDVTLFSEPGDGLLRAAAREGVPCVPVILPPDPSRSGRNEAVASVADLLSDLAPTIVLAGTSTMGPLAMLAAERAGVPVRVLTVNGLPLELTSGKVFEAAHEWEKLGNQSAHGVICISQSLLRRYREFGLDPDRKARVLGAGSSNGVDVTRFRPPFADERIARRASFALPTRAPVLGWVGRLARIKGVADLAKAFLGHVVRHRPDAHLLLVGADEAHDSTDAATLARLRSHPHVHVVGYAEDPAPYFRVLDVLAVPSAREGFSNVSLEAAACGVPVVGYATTGVLDAVADGETGTLVRHGDVAGLAAAITTYFDNPGLAARHGTAGRERAVQLFSNERCWDEITKYLRTTTADLLGPSHGS